MTFEGFPVAALDFYDDLELDNTKSFWDANKGVWKESVQAPMQALMDEVAAPFGTAKIFRPYRDVRFAKDKTPYKTHQGVFVAAAPATGWYFEISARGTRVGGGFYEASGPRLAALRDAIAHDVRGAQFERIIADLAGDGWEIGGEKLKTSPRGHSADHPRIELLRHKQLYIGRDYGWEGDAVGPGLAERLRQDWELLRPAVDWLSDVSE